MGGENTVRGLKGEPQKESSSGSWGKLESQGVSVRFYLKDQVGKNMKLFSYLSVSKSEMTFVGTISSELIQPKADYRQLEE